MTYPWTAGEVLAAADLNSAFAAKSDLAMAKNAQTGTSYSYALADQTKLLTMNNAAANTVTVTKQATVTWVADTQLRILNLGAGVTTLVADTGVTINNNKTLAQWAGGVLIRTASDVWTLVPFANGVGAANFSDAATGTYTGYKYLTFTASGTITITTAGFADILLVGGGGGGGNQGGGGGAGGHLEVSNAYLPVGTLTVTVGAGGAGAEATTSASRSGANGVSSRVGSYYSTGGGGGGSYAAGAGTRATGFVGGSGGGAGQAGASASGGTGTSGQGNNGGGNGGSNAAGGGGGASAVGTVGANNVGGNGGAGSANSYTGASVTRAGGGGGATRQNTTIGNGGAGGGGNATANNTTGTAGTTNTGGGGGGGGYVSGAGGAGGAGGSGVVVVRVAV